MHVPRGVLTSRTSGYGIATSQLLSGLRIAVTRPRSGPGEDRLAALLSERGATAIHLATTRAAPASDSDPLAEAARRIGDYDWLIVTSGRAVPPLMEALSRAGVAPEDVRSGGVCLCAVGPRTGEALSVAGLSPDLVPDRFDSEGVIRALLEGAAVEGRRVLFPRVEEGRDVIPTELAAAGATVDVVPAYRIVGDPEESARLAELVGAGGVDALTFTAGSAARSFAEAWEGRGPLPEGLGVVALGPATAEALREVGLPAHRIADLYTLAGLVEALEQWARGRGEAR